MIRIGRGWIICKSGILYVSYVIVVRSKKVFMKAGWRLIGLIILWLFQPLSASAQLYQFRHLTVKEGLSQSSVNCIMQDRHGFLWIGTQDGLNRYDGYDFRIYRYDPADSNTLSNDWIWDVLEDRSGKIWIATWKGLTKYDPCTDCFTRYLPDVNNPGAISGERPASLCQDKEGNLWIGIWGGGLDRYDPETDGFVRILSHPEDPKTLPGNLVRDVFYDHKNRLWVGTWSGLGLGEKQKDGSVTFTRFVHDENDPRSIGSNHVMSVLEDHTGRIWIGTRGGGLNLFSEKDSSFEHFVYEKENAKSISSNDICVLYEDSQHRFWVGTFTEGLNLFDPVKGTFTRIPQNPDDPKGLLSNNVYSITEDRSGLLWIGAGGLNILDPRMVHFRYYRYSRKNKFSLSNNDVSSFYEDNMGNIWVGTKGGGLNGFNLKTGRFTVYSHIPEDMRSISSNHVSAVTGDGSGTIWVATSNNGLNRFDPVSKKFTHISAIQNTEGKEMIDIKYINDLCFTSKNILWMATDNRGLVRYDVLNTQGKSYKSIAWADKIIDLSSLLTLTAGSGGKLWIGTWGVGLLSLNLKTERFSVYPVHEKDTLSLAGNMVHVIYETRDSTGRILWVGTNKGLSYMRPDGPSCGKFRHITMKNGLPSNIIYGILQDNRGFLWISTNMGLSRYDPLSGRIKNFDIYDGLQNNEFNLHACLKLQDGSLLFGGVNGFNLFRPEMIMENDYQPPVVLTSFKVFNKEMEFGKSLTEIKKIVLNWKHNFFSFEFAALDFAQSAKIQYAYRMVGVDKDWVFSDNRRYVSYTRIDPGDYVFQVKGTNRDGIWSDKILSVEIKVRPPYWRTWWFKTLGVVLFLLILYGLYRMQLQKLLALERLRVRIASDLHDDIGSALTRISIASEQMQAAKDYNRVIRLSKTIGIISREIISTMSDIIWSIDARNDTLIQLLDRMQDVAFSAFSMKNIKVDIVQKDMKKKKKIPVDYRQSIFCIYKEALNNIVKHAHATEVKIKLLNTDRGFTMEISDNGKGFDPEKLSKGNGLRNMRMRAERLKAKLEVITNRGMTIRLSMKKL